jgi:hypothetical protein
MRGDMLFECKASFLRFDTGLNLPPGQAVRTRLWDLFLFGGGVP